MRLVEPQAAALVWRMNSAARALSHQPLKKMLWTDATRRAASFAHEC
jgi:hypothetical protein